jgi:hypothetical protein
VIVHATSQSIPALTRQGIVHFSAGIEEARFEFIFRGKRKSKLTLTLMALL